MTVDPDEHTLSTLAPGYATGIALVLEEPLSMWGGLNPTTGVVIDRNHPNHGAVVTNKVLFLPTGRGSSSASSVLVEAIRLATAPCALVLAEVDEIIALGVFVAQELYDTAPPLSLLPRPAFDLITTGMTVEIDDSVLTCHPA